MDEDNLKKSYYCDNNYNTQQTLSSLHTQLDLTLKTIPDTVLEIGVGSGLLAYLLKNCGIDVTTLDFNPNLNPDHVLDLHEIRGLFGENSFDTITCFETLEHTPLKDFETILQDLTEIGRKYLIISLPDNRPVVEFKLNLPYFRSFLRTNYLTFRYKIPYRRQYPVGLNHKFEIGVGDVTEGLMRKLLGRYGNIEKELIPEFNPYHRFYVLKIM